MGFSVAVRYLFGEDMSDRVYEVIPSVTGANNFILNQRIKEVVYQWLTEFGYSLDYREVTNIEKVILSDGLTKKV